MEVRAGPLLDLPAFVRVVCTLARPRASSHTWTRKAITHNLSPARRLPRHSNARHTVLYNVRWLVTIFDFIDFFVAWLSWFDLLSFGACSLWAQASVFFLHSTSIFFARRWSLGYVNVQLIRPSLLLVLVAMMLLLLWMPSSLLVVLLLQTSASLRAMSLSHLKLKRTQRHTHIHTRRKKDAIHNITILDTLDSV